MFFLCDKRTTRWQQYKDTLHINPSDLTQYFQLGSVWTGGGDSLTEWKLNWNLGKDSNTDPHASENVSESPQVPLEGASGTTCGPQTTVVKWSFMEKKTKHFSSADQKSTEFKPNIIISLDSKRPFEWLNESDLMSLTVCRATASSPASWRTVVFWPLTAEFHHQGLKTTPQADY